MFFQRHYCYHSLGDYLLIFIYEYLPWKSSLVHWTVSLRFCHNTFSFIVEKMFTYYRVSQKDVLLLELIFWKNYLLNLYRTNWFERGKFYLNFGVSFIKFEQFVEKLSKKTYFLIGTYLLPFLQNTYKGALWN